MSEAPELSRSGPVPLSEQIAAWLRERILAGEFPLRCPLPSEKELTEQLGVSRDTARRAFAILREQGLAFTVPHRGTFVEPGLIISGSSCRPQPTSTPDQRARLRLALLGPERR